MPGVKMAATRNVAHRPLKSLKLTEEHFIAIDIIIILILSILNMMKSARRKMFTQRNLHFYLELLRAPFVLKHLASAPYETGYTKSSSSPVN